MKSLRIYLLQAAVISICAFSGCQNDELNSLSPDASRTREGRATIHLQPSDDLVDHGSVIIPPSSVVKQEYPQATSWLVTWNKGNCYSCNRDSQANIFNTTDGTFHSINSLNQSAPENSAKADISLVRDNFIQNLRKLMWYDELVPATLFVPTDLTPTQFANAVQNNPALFEYEFENGPYVPTDLQPYENEHGDLESYQTGDIYLFKTGRTPAVYGAIRIVDATSPRVIQIVVYRNTALALPSKKL
jgi:hypothetical protein